MNSCNIIIFSKDRACQLDALLRSISHHLADRAIISVLYRSTDAAFESGYDIIKSKYDHRFIPENDFKKDLTAIILQTESVLLLVDDMVFTDYFQIKDKADLLQLDEIATFSYRLGSELSYNYPLDKPERNEYAHLVGGQYRAYDWRNCQGYYGYPLSLDGHLYKTKSLLPAIMDGDYSSPNTLETCFNRMLKDKIGRLIVSHEKPKCVNVVMNRTQMDYDNRYENIYCLEYLNDRVLSGQQMDYIFDMRNKFDSCHIEPTRDNIIFTDMPL